MIDVMNCARIKSRNLSYHSNVRSRTINAATFLFLPGGRYYLSRESLPASKPESAPRAAACVGEMGHRGCCSVSCGRRRLPSRTSTPRVTTPTASTTYTRTGGTFSSNTTIWQPFEKNQRLSTKHQKPATTTKQS